MRVAIQGTHGSFSEAAARRRWPDLVTLPCREARDVVAAVRDGRAVTFQSKTRTDLMGVYTLPGLVVGSSCKVRVLGGSHYASEPVEFAVAEPGALHVPPLVTEGP